MPRSRVAEFLDALTYLYGSFAVIETGALKPELRTVITGLTRAWPLELADTERDEASAVAYSAIVAPCGYGNYEGIMVS